MYSNLFESDIYLVFLDKVIIVQCLFKNIFHEKFIHCPTDIT